jgi:hypothetical protein
VNPSARIHGTLDVAGASRGVTSSRKRGQPPSCPCIFSRVSARAAEPIPCEGFAAESPLPNTCRSQRPRALTGRAGGAGHVLGAELEARRGADRGEGGRRSERRKGDSYAHHCKTGG